MTTESREPAAGEGVARPDAAAVPGAATTDGDTPNHGSPSLSGARHRAPEPDEDEPGLQQDAPADDGAPYGAHAARANPGVAATDVVEGDADAGYDDGWAEAGDAAGEGVSPVNRRNAVILRYLLGRLAVDHLRRLTIWIPLVPVVGAVLLLVRPRWIGVAVLGLGVVLVVARAVAVWRLERRSLPARYRPVETAVRDAVEAGKANLRVELRRAGLPSRSWQLPLYALGLARGSGRTEARARLRDVDVDLVLPRAQLDRAERVLDEVDG